MLEQSLWVMVRLKNLKWHYCMKRLAYEFLDEEGLDEETDLEMRPTNEGLIDLPGMVMMDRSYRDIKIDTFKLVIPTEDFEYFYDRLKEAPRRRFRGGAEYHKVHGWQACAVFTPEQQEMVVEAMGEILPEVREDAVAETLEFTRRLAKLREQNVVSIRDPDLKGRN